ncbi:hypothetical protein QR680_009202 [Steinernema hermaphroditum]|uniref:Retrotransposon gag domain-containing protein n=1 Tax=Steinernema hermaphroditum TaxID=289476 RepID=A0AA39IJE4_9BILA|nr:hypothetical protein QR680_009202 [Steinernema hermaphroditum]
MRLKVIEVARNKTYTLEGLKGTHSGDKLKLYEEPIEVEKFLVEPANVSLHLTSQEHPFQPRACSTSVERDYNRQLKLQVGQNESYRKRTSRAEYVFENCRRERHRSGMSVSSSRHAELNNKLTTMINWQMAAVRHERLKNLKELEGYEGTSKLKEFFRRFDEMTLGYIVENGTQAYRLIKADLSHQIAAASTEGIEAHQRLQEGIQCRPNESLASYSDRVAEDVRLAFAGLDKHSTERFLNYYFLKGLNDQILASSISALQGLTFEQKVAQAVTMEATLIAAQPQHSRASVRPQISSYATPWHSINLQRQPPQRTVSFQQSFCSHCQIPGHNVSECRKLWNQNSASRQQHNFGTNQTERQFQNDSVDRNTQNPIRGHRFERDQHWRDAGNGNNRIPSPKRSNSEQLRDQLTIQQVMRTPAVPRTQINSPHDDQQHSDGQAQAGSAHYVGSLRNGENERQTPKLGYVPTLPITINEINCRGLILRHCRPIRS